MKQEWDILEEEFRHVTDKLGKDIDELIFAPVVALNALGFRTTMSCQGHIDEDGLPYPWIRIESREARKFSEEAEHLFLEEKWEEGIILRNGSDDITGKLITRLTEYLKAFYKTRRTSYDARLVVIELSPSWIELRNAGGAQLLNIDVIGRKEKLIACQKEFQRFGRFLKECFLAQEQNSMIEISHIEPWQEKSEEAEQSV